MAGDSINAYHLNSLSQRFGSLNLLLLLNSEAAAGD
jgi:hypothetical protein